MCSYKIMLSKELSAGPAKARLHAHLSFAPGISLAGGTDEMMRNIIAEQVLGLPQEPRMDKGIAFNEIPTGAN